MLRVTAAGHISTRVSSPGGLVNAGIYRPTGALIFGDIGSAPAFAGGLSGAYWSITSINTVRTTGATGTLARGVQADFPGVVTTLANAANILTTINMTSAIDIAVAWAWETADIANTATLTQLMIEVMYPGTVV